MSKTTPTKADFKSFTVRAKEARSPQQEQETNASISPAAPPQAVSSYRYLQVRLARDDANRLKGAIFSKGLSVQSVMVEALNLWMSGHGHPPIADPGTSREKQNS